jgi:hypothetical protein
MSDRDAFLADLAEVRRVLEQLRAERTGKDGGVLLENALTVLKELERAILLEAPDPVVTATLGFQLGELVVLAKGAEHLPAIRSRAKSTANLTPRALTVTDKEIADALTRHPTRKAAATSLGISDRALRSRTAKRK